MRNRICCTITLIIFLVFLLLIAYQNNIQRACEEENGWLTDFEAKGWQNFEPVSCENNDWFKIYKMPGNVYALSEPYQEQLVISYLIIGNDYSLLWDTGMGICNIKDCVTQLTDSPIVVLNSHVHFDHTGCNYLFDQVMCYDNDYAVSTLTNGFSHEQIIDMVPPETFIKKPENFSLDNFERIGKAPTATVVDGQIIDLGGRSLEVMYTPGHDNTSIMLIDEKNSILFTGDTWYPGPLYSCFENSSLPDYVNSMKKASAVIENRHIQWIYGSHNTVLPDTKLFFETTDFLNDVLQDNATPIPDNDYVNEMEKILKTNIDAFPLDELIGLYTSE